MNLFDFKLDIKILFIPSHSEFILHFTFSIINFNAVKRLIAINHIQNKSFCLHNICVCCVYLLCIYKYTHACIYLKKMFIY